MTNFPSAVTMYPTCPLPRHITTLYVVAVVSSVALFSQSIAMVGADILVYADDYPQQIEVEFRDMPSRFGSSPPLEGLKGYFVYAEPAQACSKVKEPPADVSNPTRHWILLIMRGNCSFETKVRMAQLGHYDAAIVHNVNSSELEPMVANNTTGITIPSVFVGENTGLLLKKLYQYDKGYYILINDDVPFNINTHLLLPFATVVGICTLIMVTFMIVKCVQDRRRQRRHRLPSSSLKQIPTSKFRKGDPYETCAICLDDYQEGEKLRILLCSHAYHSKCIDPWLTRNRRVCPVCKRKVFAQDERISDSDSDSEADDTTPLVRPGRYGTQGGTFDRQTNNTDVQGSGQNPFHDSADTSQNPFQDSSPTSSSNSSSSSSSWSSYGGRRPENTVGIGTKAGADSSVAQAHHQNKGTGKQSRHQQQLLSSGSVSVHTCDYDVSSEPGGISPASDRRIQEDESQDTAACYNMSSGEHSINSRPIDLDFSDDHFERDGSASQWGSRVALLGSRSEVEGCAIVECSEPAETAEEAIPQRNAVQHVLPGVQVRSVSSGHDASSNDRKPAVI